MLKLKDLDLGVREKLDVLVTDVAEAETKTKKPYVIFVVTDGDTVAKVRKWDCRGIEYERAVNRVVSMNVKSSMYGGEVTYDTDMAVYSDASVSDFVRKVPEEIGKMYEEITKRVKRFQDESLRNMMLTVLEQNEEKLMYWAAAKSQHHALYGGLLYHMYRMGKNADMQCDIYSTLNRDILVAGAYLHDIGKLKELETNSLGNADYTTEGNLLGHLYLGMETLEKYKESVDEKTLMHLKHMIASHHGTLEWGAIVEPKTAEAQMLHFLDMMDSRMYTFEEQYKDMESDSFSKTGKGQIYKF